MRDIRVAMSQRNVEVFRKNLATGSAAKQSGTGAQVRPIVGRRDQGQARRGDARPSSMAMAPRRGLREVQRGHAQPFPGVQRAIDPPDQLLLRFTPGMGCGDESGYDTQPAYAGLGQPRSDDTTLRSVAGKGRGPGRAQGPARRALQACARRRPLHPRKAAETPNHDRGRKARQGRADGAFAKADRNGQTARPTRPQMDPGSSLIRTDTSGCPGNIPASPQTDRSDSHMPPIPFFRRNPLKSRAVG